MAFIDQKCLIFTPEEENKLEDTPVSHMESLLPVLPCDKHSMHVHAIHRTRPLYRVAQAHMLGFAVASVGCE